ncbi:hypothetical protein [Nocardiopsis synnemataformans]|uniref:hypothetical protein n=1 Tax=Nocardiopsis synnemataformans TaxID=61305 RepID=UPI003EC0AE6C
MRTPTESAPPTSETATTGNTTGQDNPGASTDEQRANPDTAPAPEQRTSSSDTPQPPPPTTEDGDGQHDTNTTTENEPPQDTEDTGHNPSQRDGEQPNKHDEETSGNDDRSQDRDKDQSGDGRDQSGDGKRSGEESGDRSGDGEDQGGNDRDQSGDKNSDRSDREDSEDSEDGEDGEDGERTDDDAESVHEEDSTTEKDGQEQKDEETHEDTPAETSVPQEQETPQNPPSAENGETTEETVRTPAPTEAETPVTTEETRPEDREHEESTPPPPPAPVPTENDTIQSVVTPVDTDVTDTEHAPPPPPPPPPPQNNTGTDTGPVPLGGTSRDILLGPLSTDSPVPQDGSLTGNTPAPVGRGSNTRGRPVPKSSRFSFMYRWRFRGTPTQPDRSTQEGAPPEGAPPPRPLPTLTYGSGFVPDRSGQSYDLGYLTTSTVLGPHMLFAEHLSEFVDDVLTGTPDMPDSARQEITKGVVDILTREGPRPFLREGGHTVSTTHDGRTWSVDIDLRPNDGDFYHVDTEPQNGGGDSRFLRLHDAGPGVDSSDGGSRGAGKAFTAKFTVSPFYLGSINGNDAGPIFAVGGRFGKKVRGTGVSASASANSASGIEPLGTPNLYVGDLHMKASVTGPGLTAPRVQEGTAYNGLAMNLPGEVVSSDAPLRIVPNNGQAEDNGHHLPVNRPFIGTGHPLEITRFSPVPPASGGGTSGNTTSGDGGTGRSGEGDRSDSTTTVTTGSGRPGKSTFGTWLADHLLGPRPDGDRSSGRAPSRKEQRHNDYRERIEYAFDNDRMQQYLPQMSNGSAHIRIQFSRSDSRIMRMWSVSTEYNRKDFALGLADFVHSNTAVKSDSSSVKHSDVVSGSIGVGFGIWLDLPNGKSIRLDAPFVEYSGTFEKSTGVALNTSGTSSHVVHAPSGHAAYDVKRDFYVHIEGEPGPHRFEGESVELLTVENARLLNGETPKAPDPTGEPAAPPRPPFPNLAVNSPTDLSGATVLGFGYVPPATPENNGESTGTTATATATANTPNATGSTGTTGTTGNNDTGTANTTGTTRNNGSDGDTQAASSPQRSFYDELAYRVLEDIAEKRPGMVIPDLARTDKNYAVRPSHMDPKKPDNSSRGHRHRTFREHRLGGRRNVDVARENTLKVIKALSESGLKSGASDLPGDGIPIRLKETAVIDLKRLTKDKGLRPNHVTLRVYGDFGRLVHQFDTTASGGSRFAGSAGITTTKGSSFNQTLSVTAGGSVRTETNADARGVPRVLGNPSTSLTASRNSGKGSSQGLSHSSEETVLFNGDSDVWTSSTHFTARLFEYDDIGMARDNDKSQRERGIELLKGGMDAQTVLLTPKMPPVASDSPNTASDPTGTTRDGETATSSDGRETRNTTEVAATTDTRGGDSTQTNTTGRTEPDTTGGRQELTPEQTRDMIVRNFVPKRTPGGTASNNRGGRWTVIRNGGVHTWGRRFGGGAEVVAPPQNTTTNTTGTDGTPTVVPSPPPPPSDTTNTTNTDNNPTVTLTPPAPPDTTTNTNTGTTPETASPGGERSGDDSPASQPPQDSTTLNQDRARAIRRIGGTFERVSARFDTGDGNMRGLVEEMYQTFSKTRDSSFWHGFHHGYERKLDASLSESSGVGRQIENHLSAEEIAASKSVTTSSGHRMRQRFSGGFWSPHEVRATTATHVEADTVTDFRPTDAQMRWNGGSETTLSTNSSLTHSLGLKFGGSGGRNPNPNPSDGPLPSDAKNPIPLLGPSVARTFFSRGKSHTQSTSFTSSVLFIPNNTKVYAFRASGRVTQAIEFLKVWSIGPPLNWKTLFHGWTAPVQDLLSGYVHSRDAHQEGLVMDKAERKGDRVVLSPQSNPKKPDNARVRPGFENNGRQIQPADPGAAIQKLVNELAKNGLELTGGGREDLLARLTTHLGQNPNSTVPVPVKVRALGPDWRPRSWNRVRWQRSSSPGKVYVNLTRDPSSTKVSYVGQSGYYIESHTWKATDEHSRNRGTGTTVGADGSLLAPLPYAQDDRGPDEQPDHRQLFSSPAGAVSSSTNDVRSSGESQDDARTVELHLNTPYAKVKANTKLTLTLELGEPKGGKGDEPPRSTYTGTDDSGQGDEPPRSTYTGTDDSGQVETLYPFAYMTFDPPATTTAATTGDGAQSTGTDLSAPPPAITTSTDGTGSTGTDTADQNTPPALESDNTTSNRTETSTSGNDRAPAPPENGGATRRPKARAHYSSMFDALRPRPGDAGPGPGNDTVITKAVMVQDGGKAIRDMANVLSAESLGWQPTADIPERGPTSAMAKEARAYLADVYGQDRVYNEIDHSLNEQAVMAVYPAASGNSEVVQFADINRTALGTRVVPSSRGAKILDALPGSQLSDSRARPRTHSASDSHGGSQGRGGEVRPSGLTTGGVSHDGHEGIYTGAPGLNTGSSHGAERSSKQAVKGYQESDKLRQGTVYLVEYDATWVFAAASKLKAPAFLHQNTPTPPSTSPLSRPTRWAKGKVTVRMAGWYSEADAITMGFLTPDQAKALSPVMDRANQAREEFSQAEGTYADTRAPLEGLAGRYAADPDGRSAESAYEAQEDKYEKEALPAFDAQIDALVETVNNTRAALEGAGQRPNGGTVPAAHTMSGDGSGGTTRAPATSTTTTGNTGTPPAPSGTPPVGTTTTPTTGTTTTGGPQPPTAVSPPDSAPAPTGPSQELVDRFLAELNLRAPEPDTPVRDSGALDSDGFRNPEGGQEQNTNTVDARVQRASDAANTAAQEARDARDDANGLSTPLEQGRADLRNGIRILTGSGGGAPAAGTGGPAEPAPASGTDDAPSPGAVRQAHDAWEAAGTAHNDATTTRDGFNTFRDDAFARTPQPDLDAFSERVTTAASKAKDADTAATGALNTVTGLRKDLDETQTRYQELSTTVEGLSGQGRPVGGDRAAQDARGRANTLVSDLKGITGRADTAQKAAEKAQTDANAAKTTADPIAAEATPLRTWAEELSTSASDYGNSANQATQNARNAGQAARRAADAAKNARTAANTAEARVAEVRTGAANATENAARAEADARAARTAADLAARAAANASRPSPGGQTASGGTGPQGTTNPPTRTLGDAGAQTAPNTADDRGRTANTREDVARRVAEDARARAQEARQTAREAAERAAQAAKDAEQLAEQVPDLRTRANTTAQKAKEAAIHAEEAQEIANTTMKTADTTVKTADKAAADARRAQQAAQTAEAAAKRAAKAVESAHKTRGNAEKTAESVRKLLEKIMAAMEPGRTSSEGGPPPRQNFPGRPPGGSGSTVPGRS